MRVKEFEAGLPDGVILKHVRLYKNQIKSAEAVFGCKSIRYDAEGKCQDLDGKRMPELDIKL